MTYDCINGWEDIIGNLVDHGDLNREDVDSDEAYDVALNALSAIGALRVRGNVIAGRHEAARAMLAALEEVYDVLNDVRSYGFDEECETLAAAIAAAKAAGITTGE